MSSYALSLSSRLPQHVLAAGRVLWKYTPLESVFHSINEILIVYPLHQVYMRAFWMNRSLPDICETLTRYDAAFWSDNYTDCALLIEKHFDGLLASFQFAIYIIVWALMLWRCCCRRS